MMFYLNILDEETGYSYIQPCDSFCEYQRLKRLLGHGYRITDIFFE